MLRAGSILIFFGYALLIALRAVVSAYFQAQRAFNLTFAAFFGFASFKILTSRLVQ